MRGRYNKRFKIKILLLSSILFHTLKTFEMALEFNDANFEELVLKTDKPVVIDLWAVWCGPCRLIAPHIEEMAAEYEGKAVIGKLDVDNNPETTARFGVRNIPTVLFLKDGEVVDKQVGAVPKSVLVGKLEKLL